MGANILEGKKFDRLVSAFEIMALNSGDQAVTDMNWAGIKNLVRSGLAKKAFAIGQQLQLEHENSMTAGIGNSTGITAASVNEAAFLAADGIIGEGIHVFVYADGYWHYGENAVSLSHYGISITGTPVEGDEVIITEAYDSVDMDVVDFADAYASQDPDTAVPALWLQSHWALNAVQFDASEAIWYCKTALSAGTYHFTIGTNWGSHCVAGKVYEFTLTQDLPVGGQIVIGTNSGFYTWGAPDVAPANWRVYTFSSATSITPIETVTLTEGNGGTDLGSLSSSTVYANEGDALNNLQRAGYGYNRWSQSGIRQWLNSDADAGKWWTPQNVYDRPPQQLATLRGFLAGLPSDFRAAIKKTKVVTALNTVTDGGIGTSEVTWDYFFLPSLEQEYIAPQLSGVEGTYWPYWKERLGLSAPQAHGAAGANPTHIRYAVENHSSAQYCRLRSAFRGGASHAWYVSSSGYAHYSNATYANRPAPACVIC